VRDHLRRQVAPEADNPLSDAFRCSERERPFKAASGATEFAAGCAPCRCRSRQQHQVFTLTCLKYRNLYTRCEKATPIQVISYDMCIFADMILIILRFQYTVRWSSEIMRQVSVTTVYP
jgi:hypothetical protein